MNNKQLSLEQQLALLHQQYVERLQHDLSALSAHVQALEGMSDANAWRDELIALKAKLHTLAGSAGTFGFPELGSLSRQLELELAEWLQLDTPPIFRQIQAFSTLFQQLLQAYKHKLQQPDPETLSVEPRRPIRLYVMEPDVQSALFLENALLSYGYQAKAVTRTEDLDTLIKLQLPDLLVLEAGANTELWLGAKKKVPPIILQAHEDTFEQRLRAVRVGAQGFFSRPLNVARLQACIQRLLAVQQDEAFRVLIVESDPLLAEHYALALQGAGLLVEMIAAPEQVLPSLERLRPDVVLMAVELPQCTGFEVAQLIRLHEAFLNLPILFLSSESDTTIYQKQPHISASDLLVRPIAPSLLLNQVLTKAQQARRYLESVSKDSLTSLLKHARIKELMVQEIGRAQRTDIPLSVVLIDVDFFQNINAGYGHRAGDQVLVSLANLLKQRLRQTDCIGRLGGDEFLFILPECNETQAYAVVEEIRIAFAALPFGTEDEPFHCTFSAGVSQWHVLQEAEALLATVSCALEEAKKQGRNQVSSIKETLN